MKKTINFILELKSTNAVIQGVTKKKPDCINHALGTMPIGKLLAHRKTQLLSFIVLQFLERKSFRFCVSGFYVT